MTLLSPGRRVNDQVLDYNIEAHVLYVATGSDVDADFLTSFRDTASCNPLLEAVIRGLIEGTSDMEFFNNFLVFNHTYAKQRTRQTCR